MQPETILFDYSITCKTGILKHLKICHGDLCKTHETYDVVICSAFKNDYLPLPRTLIGSLLEHKNIYVGGLAENPAIDLKEQGCWVSREIDNSFKQIACVELLDYNNIYDEDFNASKILTSTFSTLKIMLEELARKNKPCRSIALPVLGGGSQGFELCYIVPPLLSQCISALKNIPQLESITFYELNAEKAEQLVSMCTHALSSQEITPHVFISYSSKQQPLAYQLKELLAQNQISCWMAPESIPTGSSYQAEIPAALSKIPIVLLLLSPEAERSRWVQKEVGCTIGARHTLIPFKQEPYTHTEQFNFLLDGEQIFEAYKYPTSECYEKLVHLLLSKLDIDATTYTAPQNTPISSTSDQDQKPFTEYNDFELLDFLTHCAFDSNYQNKKHVLDSIRQLLIEKL